MGEMSITSLDVLVAAVLVLSAGFAMWRGLVHETFAILEWVAGAYVALRFTPSFVPLVGDFISPAWLRYTIVFIGTFLIVFIPLSFLSHRLEEAVRRSEIGPVDRALGLVFGIARGLVIVGFAYIAYAALVPQADRPATLTRAWSYPLIQNVSAVLIDLVPDIGDGFAGIGGGATGEPPAPAAKSGNQAKDAGTSYGAADRRALDSLIEATGNAKGTAQ